MLARAGTGLRVRLEVYDDHDDGLHLSAPADPELHRPRPHARRAAPHIAASVWRAGSVGQRLTSWHTPPVPD